jgi:dipeptidyl aminopeptidase/acylaminoacyl peptidase
MVIAVADAAQGPVNPLELIRRMAHIRGCWSPSLSPDASHVAFVSDRMGMPQVWTVDTQAGRPQLVTNANDPAVCVSWSPAGELLAFMLAPGGGLNRQVYVARPDGTGLRRLTDGGSEHNRLGRWTRDGRAVAVTSNRGRASRLDAYLVDVASGEHHLIAEGRPVVELLDVSHDCRRGILRRVHYRGDEDLFLVELSTGEEMLLTPHDPPGSFPIARFTPDNRGIYLASNRDHEHAALAHIRLNPSGMPGFLKVVAAREEAELERFELAEDGSVIAVVWNAGGCSELSLFDVASGELLPGPPLMAEVADAVDVSQDGSRVAIELCGATAPHDIWVWTRAEAPPVAVTGPRDDYGLDLNGMVRPEPLRFAAHDGLELSGWLYRPPHVFAPGPVVLNFHGGPEGQERPCFRPLYQALTAAGIAVFAPNVRGSSGFGKIFVNLDNGALRFNAIRDVEACVHAVIDAGIAQAGRIGIMGSSYGGYLTMAALTAFPEHFAVAANLYGMVNFETFFANTEPWMAEVSKRKYGDPDTQVDLLRALSPIHRLDRVRVPMMVLHGANDTNVPVVEAEQVVRSLKHQRVPVEYLLFPDEGHGFSRVCNRITVDTALVSWFVRYLNDPPPRCARIRRRNRARKHASPHHANRTHGLSTRILNATEG